jgi:hypothetical protein
MPKDTVFQYRYPSSIAGNEIAHFFWYGAPLSLYENACTTSFIQEGFDVNIWTFEDIVVPKGAKLRSAERFFSKSEISGFRQNGVQGCVVGFSNAFRYRLLTEESGWWFDTDCFCLKHQSKYYELKRNKKIVAGWQDNDYVNGAVLCIPDRQLAFNLLSLYEAIAYEKSKDFNWGDIGPKLITRFVIENNLIDDICSSNIFYPLHYSNAILALDSEYCNQISESSADSYLFHYWNEIFKQNSIDKNLLPQKGSYIYEILFSETFSLTKNAIEKNDSSCNNNLKPPFLRQILNAQKK